MGCCYFISCRFDFCLLLFAHSLIIYLTYPHIIYPFSLLLVHPQAADFFLPKGSGSAYPEHVMFRHYAGLTPLSLLPYGHAPPPVTSGGLVIGFADGGVDGEGGRGVGSGVGSGGGRNDLWGAGHRTATVPYGSQSPYSSPYPSSSSSSFSGNYGSGSGLVLPRATPNPYTIGHSLGPGGTGGIGGGGSFGFGLGFG